MPLDGDGLVAALVDDVLRKTLEEFGVLALVHSAENAGRSPAAGVYCAAVGDAGGDVVPCGLLSGRERGAARQAHRHEQADTRAAVRRIIRISSGMVSNGVGIVAALSHMRPEQRVSLRRRPDALERLVEDQRV